MITIIIAILMSELSGFRDRFSILILPDFTISTPLNGMTCDYNNIIN